MNRFRLLRHQLALGCFNSVQLHQRLGSIARTEWGNQELTPVEKKVWGDPEVRHYYQFEVPHTWRARATQGMGSHTLGYMTRESALRSLGSIVPKSAVISIDDANHFIFYKLTGD